MAQQKREQDRAPGSVFVLNDEDYQKCEEHCKYAAGRVLTTTITHPLAFARTLIQLGHEPYPIVRGKAWFVGREANFLPNVFKYIKNIYRDHGFATLYTGVGANILETFVENTGAFALTLYLDNFYPEVGGGQDLDEKKEELDAYQALRLKVRETIRASIVRIAALILARPFAVIMVRQIAQHIGNEGKYLPINPLQPLLCIGDEEGPAGFFSGIAPAAIGVLVSVWGRAAFSYSVDMAFKHIEEEQNIQDENAREMLSNSRKAMDLVITFATNNFRYPFEVVSTVMAVTGSGLFVSLLPYSPVFSHWADAYNYLKPNELYRGGKMFWREDKSPIRIGSDAQIYSSKKHFI